MILPLVVFLVVASPQLFMVVRSILGKWVASPEGLPTMAGLLLHSVVYVLLTHFLWMTIYGTKKSNYMSSCEGADAEDD